MNIEAPIAALVTVTPAIAMDMLQGNQDNRKLRETRVDYYVEELKAGRWKLTGDAICISPTGRLLNGQHRLCAIRNSGIEAPLVILRNCPEESYAVMDAGSPRTTGDLFRSRAIVNPNECAAVARFLVKWFSGSPLEGGRGGRLISPAEVESTFLNYREEIEMGVAIGKTLSMLYPAARIGLVDVVIRMVHGDQTNEWWSLVDPDYPKGLGQGHAARTLRDHMLLSPHARKMGTTEFASKAIRCFNAWREGQMLMKIGYRATDPFPEVTRKRLRAS